MFKDKVQEKCSTSQEIEQKFIFNSLQTTFVKKTESLLFSLLQSCFFLPLFCGLGQQDYSFLFLTTTDFCQFNALLRGNEELSLYSDSYFLSLLIERN